MTLHEYVSLVEKMRAAQKRFFRHRDNIAECKLLEREVDDATERIAGPEPAAQPGLFDAYERYTEEEMPRW